MIKILTEEEGPLDVLLLHFSTYTISYFLVMVALLSSGRKKAEKNYGALCWDITTHCHLFTNLWKFLPLTILARYSYSLSPPSQVTSDKEKFLYELDELQAQMEKAQLCTNRLQQEKEDYQMDAERQREKCEKLQVRDDFCAVLLLLDFLLHQAGNLTSPLIIFALSPHFSSIWCNTVLFSSYPSWMFACESWFFFALLGNLAF